MSFQRRSFSSQNKRTKSTNKRPVVSHSQHPVMLLLDCKWGSSDFLKKTWISSHKTSTFSTKFWQKLSFWQPCECTHLHMHLQTAYLSWFFKEPHFNSKAYLLPLKTESYFSNSQAFFTLSLFHYHNITSSYTFRLATLLRSQVLANLDRDYNQPAHQLSTFSWALSFLMKGSPSYY